MDWIYSMLAAGPGFSSIVSLAAKASVIIAAALAGVYSTKRSAATRYFLVSAVVLMLPALPILAALAPSWQVPLPEAVSSRLVSANVAAPAATEAHEATVSPAAEGEPLSTMNVGETSSIPYNLLILVWLAGTAVVSSRVVIGAMSASAATRGKTAIPGPELGRLERLAARASAKIGLRRGVPVMLKTDVRVPQVRGILKPVIVLPVQAAAWSGSRLTAVMLHELAHIKRYDHIVRPLANLASSWLWFNPFVWLALSRLRRESEKACDDYVQCAGTNRLDYAEQLYDMCRDLQSSAKLASAALMLIRKKELEERIVYLLSKAPDRKPMNLKRRLIAALVVALTAIPVISVSGFRSEPLLNDVSAEERDGIVTTLAEFYFELSSGSDYETVRERFLTSDYFDDPDLTLENLTEAVKHVAFDNTISLITEAAVSPAREVRGRIMSINKKGDEYVVTQHLNVMAQRVRGVMTYEDRYGNVVTRPDPASDGKRTVEDCRLVNSLGHQIRFRKEEGLWKISKFDDGVALMRMDTDNPYGPIFLFWMEDIDTATTPFGPGIFKIIPLDIVPSASNARFVLENR